MKTRPNITAKAGDLLTLVFCDREFDAFVMGNGGRVFLTPGRELVTLTSVIENIVKIRRVSNGELVTLWENKEVKL